MSVQLKGSISFVLDGKMMTKNVSPTRIVIFDSSKNAVAGMVSGVYVWNQSHYSSGRFVKNVPAGQTNDELSTTYQDFDKSGNLKYSREIENNVVTEIWYPFPGNEKIADIKILENGKEISGTRCYSESERKYYEEFSDGTKGYAEFTEDGKLLHLVDRNGYEQINTLDGSGNIKSTERTKWLGYDFYNEYIIDDSIKYTVFQREGEKKEVLNVTEFSAAGKKLNQITYRVIQ